MADLLANHPNPTLVLMANPKLDRIDAEARDVTKKLVTRVQELGDVDVMTIRNDREINDLLARICRLYSEGGAACTRRGSAGKQVCELFKDEPEVVRWLELSEEKICPIMVASSKGQKESRQK